MKCFGRPDNTRSLQHRNTVSESDSYGVAQWPATTPGHNARQTASHKSKRLALAHPGDFSAKQGIVDRNPMAFPAAAQTANNSVAAEMFGAGTPAFHEPTVFGALCKFRGTV